MIYIHILHVTRLYICLINTVTCSYPIVDFLLVLEESSCLVTPEVTDGVTILCTIELLGILINLIIFTMDDTIKGRDITYFIMVVGKVGTYTVSKVSSDVVIP